MKRYQIPTLFLCIVSFAGYAQTENIEDISRALAQQQLEAYNKRNIDEFLIPYSDSIKVYTYPNELRYQGKETMRKRYAGFFERTPDLHCEVVSRTVYGNVVIDKEALTGIGKDKSKIREALAIYTIEYGKISEVRFVRKPKQ
ncbi:nuclear transport factor 2 family protein [Aquimarina hainanensis]|uniref:Nuclear transport factor 2 family protein n=1 Tax=Aquimarina hainanensis TaxID=1578017 RepID=A0ABW5N6I5_9FLAO